MEVEKEYYKSAIADMINGIDDVKFLVYLHRLLQNIIKAGR